MSETALAPAISAAPVPSPSPAGSDAIKLALAEIRASLPKLQELNPAFASSIERLIKAADDPVRLNSAEFQHRIAYAVADVQRVAGPLDGLDGDAREQLKELSVSAPSLTNVRARTLLSEANFSEDGSLRNDIRRTAFEIGRQEDQQTPQIVSQLEALENRVRLSPAAAPAQPSPSAAGAGQAAPPLAAGLDAAGRPSSPAKSETERQANTEASTAVLEAVRAPGVQQQIRQPQPNQDGDGQIGAGAAFGSAMLRGFQKLGEAIPPPPWEAMTTNFGDRLRAFENRRQVESDLKVIAGVEQSGATALSALQSLSNNEGAVMMNRINQAARSDPNGIEGVLAEMRPGGKYAGLRQQFNGAINDEKGLAAAYDKAVEAVGQYAYDRKAAAPIVARSPDAVAVTARLEALEQNVGERMAGIPSLSDGKTMLDDLRKQAAEVFKAVAEGIKNLFQRVSASPGPSP